MRSSILTAVIADADGLLFDSEKVFDVAVQQYTQHLTGQAWSEVELRTLRSRMFGRKKEESAQLLYTALGIDPATLAPADRYLEWRVPILQELFPKTELLPGVEDLTRRLSAARVPLAIATSSTREDLELKSTLHPQLLLRFSVIVTADHADVKRGKPAPDLFLVAARELGMPIPQCVVFEDAVNGVEAALAAGAGLVVAVPDQRAERIPFTALQQQAPAGTVVILNSLEEFDPRAFGLIAM